MHASHKIKTNLHYQHEIKVHCENCLQVIYNYVMYMHAYNVHVFYIRRWESWWEVSSHG